MSKENLYWIQITSGDGPSECALAARKTIDYLQEEAKNCGLKTEILGLESGKEKGTCISALIAIQGKSAMEFMKSWQGTIKWICQSPYRSNHKRKNWFVGIDILEPTNKVESINLSDVQFTTMRSSGAGGQHVNTTDSAVRIKHIPTGITTIASEERSQYSNKKLALARLTSLLKKLGDEEKMKKNNEKWTKHSQLERGNPTRIFIGKQFKEKKNI